MSSERDDERVPVWVLLASAVALTVALRLLPVASVFRGGDIVLLSNDPYAYVYLVERAVETGEVARFDPSVQWIGEPLLIWTLAVPVAVFGVESAPVVLAVYPVVAAGLTALLVFDATRTLTGDVRAGIVGAVGFAVTPLLVSRTALGMGDHHAFDYFWLALTVATLLRLLTSADLGRRRARMLGVLLGVAVAGQTLAWDASPILLVPTGLAVGLASLVVVGRPDGPARFRPVVGGLALAAVVVALAHVGLGWKRLAVAVTPALLSVGAAAVTLGTAAVARRDRSWATLSVVHAGTLVVLGAAVWLATPDLWAAVTGRLSAFVDYVEFHRTTGIGETAPLTTTYGPVLGPLILLGYTPVLAIPGFVQGLRNDWRRRSPGWLVVAAYLGWFLALAFVQRRFAVELGLVLAVAAGPGFLVVTTWLGLTPPVGGADDSGESTTTVREESLPRPERERLALLGALGLVGVGTGTLFSRGIVSRLAVERSAHAAAAWTAEFADRRGLSYPDNYVLAPWSDVRMYNYLVNGESRGYGYARDTYEPFVFGTDPDEWYDRFEGRVGFVVTEDLDPPGFGTTLTYHRLHEAYGSATRRDAGVGHYRALWTSPEGDRAVFAVVPGATIVGRTAASRVTVRTTVSLAPAGEQFTYERRARPDSDGTVSVRVAHPGEYSVGEERVTVPEAAVWDGATVDAGEVRVASGETET